MSEVLVILSAIGVLASLVGLGFFLRWFNARAGRYFVRYAGPEQLAALRAVNIPAQPGSYRANEDPGILIKRKHFEKACEALSSYVVTIFPTEVKRIHEAVLRPIVSTPSPHRVFTRGFIEPLDEQVSRLVSDIITPAVKCAVQITNYRRQIPLPAVDDFFYIFLCSSPGYARQLAPHRLQGVEFLAGEQWFAESGMGAPLTDGGTTYGELVGNCLYLHPLFGDLTDGPRLALLTRLLERCAPELDVDALISDVINDAPNDGMFAINRQMSVFDEGFDQRRKAIVKAIVARTIMPAALRHIHVKDCSGSRQAPFDDEMFHIFHNGSPDGADRVPSGKGLPIMDQKGLIIGELVESNLYIYQNVLKFGTRKEAQALLQTLLIAKSELLIEQSTNADETHRQRFIEVCMKQIDLQPGSPNESLNEQLQAADNDLRHVIRQCREAEQEVVRAESSPEEVLGKEYDSLFKLAKVRNLRVTNESIIVETDMIYCRDPRSKILHQLGEFEIHLPVAGKAMVILNKAGPTHLGAGQYMNAPHVNSAGYPCLGNTNDTFEQLFRERQFASAVQFAIVFLESVNTADAWGRSIDRFPVAAVQN